MLKLIYPSTQKKCIYCGNHSICVERSVIIPTKLFKQATCADYCNLCWEFQNYRYYRPWEIDYWKIFFYQAKYTLWNIENGYSFFMEAIAIWKTILRNEKLCSGRCNLFWMRLNGEIDVIEGIRRRERKGRGVRKHFSSLLKSINIKY